jgi:hypothetical protein
LDARIQETNNHRSNFSVQGSYKGREEVSTSLEQASLFVASGHTHVHIRERGVVSRKRMNDFFGDFLGYFFNNKIITK